MSRGRHAMPRPSDVRRAHRARRAAALTRTERRAARRRSDRRTRLLMTVMGAVIGLTITGAGVAFGYWLTTSSNTAQAVATSLSAPTSPTATETGSGAITIGWTLPGSQLAGAEYQVKRTTGPGSPTTVCTVAFSLTSCPDTGLTANTAYGYSIVAILDSWQSPAITTSATTATPTFSIALSATTTKAGTPITVQTITAKVGITTDTTYTGAKTITWSGLANSPSSQAPSYPSSAVTFTNGVASPGTTVTAYDAVASTLTATDANATAVTGTAPFAVTPAAADSGGSLILGAATTNPTTGSGDNLTVTADDEYGNRDTNYTGAKNLSFTGASTIGSFAPTVTDSSGTATAFNSTPTTATNFTSGQSTVSGTSNGVMTLYKVETAHVIVSDDTINNGSGLTVTVVATASKLVFTTVPSGNQTASANATIGPYQVQEQDTYGNPVTAGSDVTLNLSTTSGGTTFFSATSGGTSGTSVTIASGQSTSGNFYYADTKAGAPTLTAQAAGITNNGTTSPTIVGGAAASLSFVNCSANGGSAGNCLPSIAVGGNGGYMNGYVIVLDTFGNPAIVSGTSTWSVTLTSNNSEIGVTFSPVTISGPANLSGTAFTLTHEDGNPQTATITAHETSGSPNVSDGTMTVTN
jgi:hypothetical protein